MAIEKASGSASDAVRYALRLLSYRPRSERELRERLLRKGVSLEDSEAAIERMKALGYVDDAVLAESLRRIASEGGKKLGAMGALRFMRQRGIPDALARTALEGYDETAPAERFAQKRMASLSGLPRDVAKRRLTARLARRGFGADTIRNTVKNSFLREDKTDDEKDT